MIKRAPEQPSLKQKICGRLKHLRQARGFHTAKAFALQHALKISTYSLHEAGTRTMSFDVIEHYCQLLDVHVNWLLTGDAPYYPTNLPSEVPLIDWHEVLLFPSHINLASKTYVVSEVVLASPSFAVRMQDNSMAPRYPHHAVLFIAHDQLPADREYALFLNEKKEVVLKQFLTIDGIECMRSLNEEGSLQKINKEIKIIGKVVQAKLDGFFSCSDPNR